MAESGSDSDYTTLGTLKTARSAPLPEIVDVFIAGGGPAGIAAAMKATELGLTSLIVDYDDLMKRIRDYPKEKDIYPNFGGGDKLDFPPGGPLVTGLQFDPIDKDRMVVEWKQKCREASLLAKIGSELTHLKRVGDGVYEARVWNHRGNVEVFYRARNVILSIGAGSPRRFDIPGNTDGLAFRLDDAEKYVGGPALVIGGGTSACEAVIYISNAKAKAGDATAVYWSYRADKMPKVSKALSDVFFDAYVGNGNIHYLPFSEATAVVTGPDKQDYLSLRVDRKVIVGRPVETVHLEFPKQQVVACIGEDPPFKFLQNLGVKVPTVGERPVMLLSHEGETSLRGVFLVGDARGARYLRCREFEDSGTYEQVTQKRNIKQGLWDAVQAVEVIGSRLGKPVMALDVAPAVEGRPAERSKVVPPTPTEPSAQRRASEFQVVLLLPDGTRESEFPMSGDCLTIGRKAADVACPEDVYMADLHAAVTRRAGAYELEDRGGSGVWLRVAGGDSRALEDGDSVWLGAQLIVLGKSGAGWVLEHYNGDGVLQAKHPVGAHGVVVGKTSAVPLDKADAALSRRHAGFRLEAGRVMLSDLGSTNGTYVKLTKPTALRDGDEFRVGGKRFRAELFREVADLPAGEVVVDKPIAESAPAPAGAPVAAVMEGLIPVVIEHPQHPASFGVAAGQPVLHAFFEYLKARYPGCKMNKKGVPAEHNEEPLDWQCLNATCGLCAVQIVSGAENFLPPDPGSPEMKTLEFPRGLDGDPQRYRLTCVAKIKGAVRLTVPE